METMTEPTTIAFETALGRCGLRWNEFGITSVLLPSHRLDEVPVSDGAGLPRFVRDAIEGLTEWLGTGDEVEMDGRTGEVRRLVRAAERVA